MTWPEIIHDLTHKRWLVRVNWTNAGVMPVLRPHVMERLEGQLVVRGYLGVREGVTTVVAPGESDGRAMRASEQQPFDLYVEFSDGRGHLWRRDLNTGKYLSRRKMRRWIRRSERLKQAAETATPASPLKATAE